MRNAKENVDEIHMDQKSNIENSKKTILIDEEDSREYFQRCHNSPLMWRFSPFPVTHVIIFLLALDGATEPNVWRVGETTVTRYYGRP